MSEFLEELVKSVEEFRKSLIKGTTMDPRIIEKIINDFKEGLKSLPEKAILPEYASQGEQANIRKLIFDLTQKLEEMRMTFVGKMAWDPRFGGPLKGKKQNG